MGCARSPGSLPEFTSTMYTHIYSTKSKTLQHSNIKLPGADEDVSLET